MDIMRICVLYSEGYHEDMCFVGQAVYLVHSVIQNFSFSCRKSLNQVLMIYISYADIRINLTH